MVLKLFLRPRHNTSSGEPEGADQSEKGVDKPDEKLMMPVIIKSTGTEGRSYQTTIYGIPEEKEDDLNATDDGEPSEESHGASDETQLGLCLDLLVSLNLVKGCRVKVDLH